MKHTDTELLDYLQRLNDRRNYTGTCVLRESTTGRGWRLHETSQDGAVADVRAAIAAALDNDAIDVAPRRRSTSTMNIYARRGSKVVFANPTAGFDHDQKQCRELLVEGQTYTIQRTEVHNFHTDVWLQEFPGSHFNSVMFKDAE